MGIELENFLNTFHDMLFIISDENGRVIYPEDPGLYDYETKLVKIKDDRYFNPLTNMWYQFDRFTLGKYTIRRWIDITKYVKKEDMYDLDPLTGIYLRRKLLEEFKEYLLFAQANAEEFTICMGDLDKFKRVNDDYGHLAGDEVLRTVAHRLSDGIRHNIVPTAATDNKRANRDDYRDVIGRYGGEEFILLIKNIDEDTSYERVENLRESIQDTPVFYKYPNDGKEILIPITISFGAVHILPDYLRQCDLSEDKIEHKAKALVELADENLYLAKRTRNKTVFSTPMHK